MGNRVYGSYEEFAAAKNPAFRRAPAAADPLEKFYLSGWWWPGEIVEYAAGALPTTVAINGIFQAREAAMKGWLPVQFLPEPVLDLLLAYHAKEGLPSALAEPLKERLAERAKKKPA